MLYMQFYLFNLALMAKHASFYFATAEKCDQVNKLSDQYPSATAAIHVGNITFGSATVPDGVLGTAVVVVYVPLCRRRWLLGWS